MHFLSGQSGLALYLRFDGLRGAQCERRDS